MKQKLKVAVLAWAIGMTGAAAVQAETVRVAFSAEPYPPFTSLDASGKWVGWEVEFEQAVCKQAKLDCVITPVAWDGIIPALTSHKIDAIMSSMSITAERLKTISFSDKYYNTPAGIVGNKDDKFGATPDDLAGKVIGVQISTNNADYVKKHFAGKAAEIKEYQTQDEANQDLAAGRIDAIQADTIALNAFLTSDAGKCCDYKGNVADDPAVLGTGMGIGLRKEDTALRDKFNTAIKAIRADGTYDKFSKKYFNFNIYGN